LFLVFCPQGLGQVECGRQFGLGKVKTIFAGKDLTLPRLIRIWSDSVSAVQEGAGGMHGGFPFVF
jgi:hypothetical protein